ncbi:MAG: hypothetical protein AAF401_15510, partial [Pseudomonadota bacterium]
MKGNISRLSHRARARYSGVFQVQGGMVTDADLGEEATLARTRADNLGHDAVGCGVPEEGGAVQLGEAGPTLAPGVVYAEGVRGVTQAVGGLIAGQLGFYDLQTDFPLPPDLPNDGEALIYADIWERTVTPLEDGLLSDPGLHGAETSLRQRTMAQIKAAPLEDGSTLGDPGGLLPRVGDGQLTATPIDPETIADDCDPCADVVTAEQTVANALFRIEIVHVHGDAQAPERVMLAWSAENASAVAPADVNAEDFGRAGAVYEYFSYATECHLGVHSDNGAVARSSFGASLAAGATVVAAPEGGDWPFVRRWGGAAEIIFASNDAERVGGGGGISVSDRTITLTTDAFTAELNLNGRPVVAGDFWLVEMRRFADDPIRVVSASPIGIVHHYCPLFRIEGGSPLELTDEEMRRLSFPTLADMPASHVSIVNNCEKLYADAENVQEALDNLCDISAEDIALDP